MSTTNVVSLVAKTKAAAAIVAATPPSKRAMIEWGAEPVQDIAEEVIDLIVARNGTDPVLFNTCGRISRLKPPKRKGGAPTVEELGYNELSYEIGQLATFFKTDKQGRVSYLGVPKELASYIFGMPDQPALPPLNSVVTTPFFDPSFTLVSTNGYHEPSAAYLQMPTGFALPWPVMKTPNADAMRLARTIIWDTVQDFPFDSRASFMNYIGLDLLPFVRPAIDGATPIHFIEKPAPGTGAGLLVDRHTLITTGQKAGMQAQSRDEDEFRKNFTTFLLSGGTHFILDNVRHVMNSGPLAMALTADAWKDRVLGGNKMADALIRCIFVFTANNPEYSSELARRMTSIRLDANMADPTKGRTFKHPKLTKYVEATRPRIIWAYLTIIRAWVAAGRPEGDHELASFESWSHTIGGILKHAYPYGGEFLNNRGTVNEKIVDEEAGSMQDFVEAWWNTHGSAQVPVGSATALPTVGGVVGSVGSLCKVLADNRDDIDLGFNAKAPGSWARALGHKLKAHNHQTFEVTNHADGSAISVKLQRTRSNGTKYSLTRIKRSKGSKCAS